MRITRDEAQRWLQRFDAAERADLEARRRLGPCPEWSLNLALSLIRAARLGAGGTLPVDPRRNEEDERVRDIWARLRSSVVS